MPSPAATTAAPRDGRAPELDFSIEDAQTLRHAASPTIALQLRIARSGGGPVRSLVLSAQVRIAATRRGYSEREQQLLSGLFGPSEDWGRNLHSLLWTNQTLTVPGFDEATVVELPLPCSYDFEVSGASYLHALGDGVIPLELMFGGTVFYAGEEGRLQTSLISWNAEASYQLPAALWRATIDHHFPDSAWLRIGRESFERLAAYRARHALASWEDALGRLLPAPEESQ